MLINGSLRSVSALKELKAKIFEQAIQIAALEVDQTIKKERIEELEEVIRHLIAQYAYAGKGVRHTGGIAAMEMAFEALGLEDPHPLPPSQMCDEPGCKSAITCGWPSPTGYRSTCSEHYQGQD